MKKTITKQPSPHGAVPFVPAKRSRSKVGLFLVLLAALPAAISAQVITYSFTNCGATGLAGPTQGNVNTGYASTNLSGSVTVTQQGVQTFTVPASGPYRFVVAGAAGGDGFSSAFGCRGRIVQGEMNLTAGQVLKIVVGQKGAYVQSNGSSAGGGGSYVATISNVPIIVGGGGAGFHTPLTAAVPSSDGNFGTNGFASVDGTGGGGANGTGGLASSSNGWSGGGGGFSTDGTVSPNCGSTQGFAFVNGSNGGNTCNNTVGGFGGGGGTHGNTGGGGGGGGYSGGGGCNQTAAGTNAGGGGGSYMDPTMTNVANLGTNNGHGYVTITKMCDVSVQASSNPICFGQSLTLSTNAVSNITWTGSSSTANSIVVSPNVTTTYSVTGTSTANCISSAVIVVTVNPLPVLSAMITPTTLCVGKTATVTLSGAATYTWNNTAASSPVFTVNPLVTTSYPLIGKTIFNCVSNTNISVNVNTNVLTVSPAATVCTGKEIDLMASGADTYTWSSGSMFPTAHVQPNATGVYNVSGTDQYNCVLSNSVNVTVIPTPTVTAGSNKQTICKGEAVTLTAGGAGAGGTYTWSNGSTGSPISVTLPVDVVYTYTVTGTDANGCTNVAIVSVSANKCVGINEVSAQNLNFNAYPNPVSSDLFISLNNGLQKTIEVMDVTGKVVLSTVSQKDLVELNMTSLASGFYMVKVTSDGNSGVIKIVKQ